MDILKIRLYDKSKDFQQIQDYIQNSASDRLYLCLNSLMEDDDLKLDYWNTTVVIVFDDAVCGFASINHKSYCADAYITKLCVFEGARRRGFGTLLLDRVINLAREQWYCRRITLNTVEGNEAANCLYKKSGFISKGMHYEKIYHDGKLYGEEYWVKVL